MGRPRPAPRRAARCRASQSIASTSRWLVGSSSSSRSCSPSSTAASATRRDSPPDSRSAGRPGRHRSSRAASTALVRGSPPIRAGAVADDHAGHAAGQLAALGQHAERRSRLGSPGRVRLLPAAEHGQQRALPGAVAADHADPVPGGHPGRHVIEQQPVPYALTAPSRLTRLAGAITVADRRPAGLITVAPEAGPVTVTTDRHTPVPVSATARSRACLPSRAR